MGFLDNLTKTISQGVDRAKFEADKFQKTTRIQTEISELKKQIDLKRMECGDRALDLYRAGQIQSTTLGELLQSLEALRTNVTLKEEELKVAQAEALPDAPPVSPASVPGQQVPISSEPPMPTPPQHVVATDVKSCPNCQFHMPASAMFCPSCGARVNA